MTTDVLDAKDLFLSHYRDFQKRYGRADDGLAALRGSAMERFGDLGLPSQRDENWRFTPLTALADTPFQLADHSADDLDTAEFERLLAEPWSWEREKRLKEVREEMQRVAYAILDAEG